MMSEFSFFSLLIYIMVCKTSCAIACAFMGGMLWTILNKDSNVMTAYHDTLDADQKVLANAISRNRAWIWLKGIVIGLMFGLIYLYMFNKGSNDFKGCMFAAIVMGTNYMYYTLADKGTYMINHLRQNQIDEWFSVKQMMQRNYHVGALLGVMGCFFLGRAF